MYRELNEIEYFNYAVGQPYNIAIVVTVKGSVTSELLQSAFRKLQIRHPLLSVSVIIDKKGMPWFRTIPNAKVPLTVVSFDGPELSLHLLEKELSTPFEMSESLPLVRISLITSPNPQILICMQHVICDGISYAFLLRDLLKLFSQSDLSLSPLSITEHFTHALPKKIAKKIPKTTHWFKIFFFIVKIIHWLKIQILGKKKSTYINNQDRSYRVHSWSLSSELTTQLLERCKKERVSVHSALCTAFLSFNSIINNPVNLRNRLSEPVGEALGLFAGGAVVSMKYKSSLSYWENARNYNRKLQKQLRDRKLFRLYRLLTKKVPLPEIQQFGQRFIDLAAKQRPFAITNLGDLDRLGIPSNVGTYQLLTYIGGVSGGNIDAVSISIYTLRKELHFNINYYAYMTKDWDFQEIASVAMKKLTQAIS